jgi:hypothetical protein
MAEDIVRDEGRARSIHVSVPVPPLMTDKEALWYADAGFLICNYFSVTSASVVYADLNDDQFVIWQARVLGIAAQQWVPTRCKRKRFFRSKYGPNKVLVAQSNRRGSGKRDSSTFGFWDSRFL